ncbi:Gfo/Idh/MocA family oxidoreductase [Persephonella atlantica]|uniref:Gfo/Idh/MocA family oxidoreductase n=1 Tax=Persephonella atlantica TaxID=2699429 RepID=A0ABS1GJR4_9AQUI|nr:Gfo/Idh/MocA family oxidoreductase [Persephonella atlantica]MBK3333169.1 Gfo/Idh/MocA family oxidoreductase [Persephonella atlantica]
MKVGIVGTGNMGSKYIKKFEVLGYDAVLIDLDASKLSQYPERFNKYTQLDEALKKENITHLFIATDPKSHIPLALKGLERGINVMVEKPPAINPSQLEKAIEFAQKKNTVLSVSEIELKSSIVRNLNINSDVEDVHAYRLNLGRGYINPFYDLAWHDLYIMNYLFGDFRIKKVVDKGDIYDIYGETQNSEFFLQVAWSHKFLRREWEIITPQQSIKLNFAEDRIVYEDGTTVEKDGKDKLELMIKQFVENPSFESSYRALNILKEFSKFTA